MTKRKLTLQDLRDKAHDVDQNILRTRKILEAHAAELAKLHSQENKRRLTPAALAEDTEKLRRKTELSLSIANVGIAQAVRESFEHRGSWTYEHTLRNARFAPEASANPGTPEAELRSLYRELMETFKRGNAENRAHRYTTEDLIAETERAALNGEVATVQVYRQAARDRQLQGVEKVNFDLAFRKLHIEEIDQAQAIFSELEGLSREADSLFTLWREPGNQMAQADEQLGRFNRRKKAEAIVKEAETRAASEPEQSSAA